MSRVLATYNIKGGVGKTSAAVNLATLAAHDGAPDAAVGPRPAGREHLPVPRPARRSRAAARSSCAARPTSTAQIKGTDHRGPGPAAGRLLLPPHGPRARRRQEAERRARRACSSRSTTSTSTRSWTARRASPRLRERVRGRRRAARPDHPGDALLAHARAAAPGARRRRPAGARLLLDGRPPQEAAPRADGRARGRARHARDGDPELAPTSSGWAPERAALVDFAPRSRAARAYADLWRRSASACEMTGRAEHRGRPHRTRLRSRRAAAAPPAATRAS